MTADIFIVSKDDLGIRLDKFLAERFSGHSRTYFQYLIDEKCVLVNGIPVKKQHKISAGEQIEISFRLTPQIDVKPQAIPLDILFEDQHLLVINKPVGMVVHPAPGAPMGTFANALLHHCKELDPEEFEDLRPGIVHRLDKDTSGVLIGAKTQLAHQKLTEQFSNRKIEKRYLGICSGVPKEGHFSAPIHRHPIHRQMMTVCEEGKEAITDFKILAKKGSLTLVEALLITGRTHQIRVHLRKLNCPLLGDALYGSDSINRQYKIQRQLLHAYSIQFVHPISEKSLHITAPIPADMKNFIELIRRGP